MFKGFRILLLASAAIIPWAATATNRTPVSTANAEHYTWGNCCEAWYLVKTAELTVIHERMPPGTAEARHRHNISRQFFYVLAGSAVMEHDGKLLVLHPHEGIEIPPGVAHCIKNEGKTALDILVTSQPPSHTDRVNVDDNSRRVGGQK